MLSDEEKEKLELEFQYALDNIVSKIKGKTATAIVHSEQSMILLFKRLMLKIEKQSKEIEHQIEKRANQRNELAILNAKQVEFNKLVNTVNSYKGQFKRQQKEIEELKDFNTKLQATKDRLDSYDKENTLKIEKLKNKCKELIFEKQELTSALLDSTPNDKIKAKIEEYEKQIEKMEKEDIGVGFTLGKEWSDLKAKIEFGQSLLEKE